MASSTRESRKRERFKIFGINDIVLTILLAFFFLLSITRWNTEDECLIFLRFSWSREIYLRRYNEVALRDDLLTSSCEWMFWISLAHRESSGDSKHPVEFPAVRSSSTCLVKPKESRCLSFLSLSLHEAHFRERETDALSTELFYGFFNPRDASRALDKLVYESPLTYCPSRVSLPQRGYTLTKIGPVEDKNI